MDDNIIPLGHRHPSKLPHPKRVLNGNEIDHALSELGGALAYIINPLRQQTLTTAEIISQLSGEHEEICEARKRLNEPEYPLSLMESLTAFRHSIHQGKIIVVDDALEKTLANQPDLREPYGKLYLPDIPYGAYFKLGQEHVSEIMLPPCGKCADSAPLEGFYFFQYDHPEDWMRDITITLIGTPTDQYALHSHATSFDIGIRNGRYVEDNTRRDAENPKFTAALNHAYTVLDAFNHPPEKGWRYRADHQTLFKTATTNRDVRLKGSFDHYTMESV